MCREDREKTGGRLFGKGKGRRKAFLVGVGHWEVRPGSSTC